MSRFFPFYWLAATLLLGSLPSSAQVPSYVLVEGTSVVQTKNYYLLTLFQQVEEVKRLLEKDTELAEMARTKRTQLSRSLTECEKTHTCFTERMKLSEVEISHVSDRLKQLYQPQNALGKLVAQHLVPSGTYILFGKVPSAELLVKAWEQDARGLNYALGVYAEGQKPHYPNIDSISYLPRGRRYFDLVYTATEAIADESQKATLFFEPTLNAALRFLEINHRSEAADFEPMTATVNKAAYDRLKSTSWDKYPYSLILVPGSGPSEPQVALSGIGLLRCRTAALRYFEGMAPFIMVSGGRVHPYQTPYSEAYEMKKYLVETMKVPESAILMEPHARHTTTNLRNCARLIYRYGLPSDKPYLISTSKSQSFYISSSTFEERCQKELLHLPYRPGKRLSNTETEYYPVLEALHSNPREPLDP